MNDYDRAEIDGKDAEKSSKARLKYQRWFNMAFLGGDLDEIGTKMTLQDYRAIMRSAGLNGRFPR